MSEAEAAPFEDDQEAELANREARNEVIRSTFEEMYRLDVDQAEAEEKHMKPIKDAKKKAWRTLKADTGLAIGNAKDFYKIFAKDRDSQSSEDESDNTQDDYRELFNATVKGGQVNFLDAFDIHEK